MSKEKRQIEEKRAFTLAEAAAYACVSRGTVHTWIVTGLVPFEELPGRGGGLHRFRRIRKSDLDVFLDKHFHSPKDSDKHAGP
jgi:hypothetical protein